MGTLRAVSNTDILQVSRYIHVFIVYTFKSLVLSNMRLLSNLHQNKHIQYYLAACHEGVTTELSIRQGKYN